MSHFLQEREKPNSSTTFLCLFCRLVWKFGLCLWMHQKDDYQVSYLLSVICHKDMSAKEEKWPLASDAAASRARVSFSVTMFLVDSFVPNFCPARLSSNACLYSLSACINWRLVFFQMLSSPAFGPLLPDCILTLQIRYSFQVVLL